MPGAFLLYSVAPNALGTAMVHHPGMVTCPEVAVGLVVMCALTHPVGCGC